MQYTDSKTYFHFKRHWLHQGVLVKWHSNFNKLHFKAVSNLDYLINKLRGKLNYALKYVRERTYQKLTVENVGIEPEPPADWRLTN